MHRKTNSPSRWFLSAFSSTIQKIPVSNSIIYLFLLIKCWVYLNTCNNLARKNHHLNIFFIFSYFCAVRAATVLEKLHQRLRINPLAIRKKTLCTARLNSKCNADSRHAIKRINANSFLFFLPKISYISITKVFFGRY